MDLAADWSPQGVSRGRIALIPATLQVPPRVACFPPRPAEFERLPMNVTFACPHCEQSNKLELTPGADHVTCERCQKEIPSQDDAWQGEELKRCLICGSGDLFVRKDFPQRLGLAIVVGGLSLSCVTWFFYHTYLTFAVLFLSALADMALFLIVGESVACYRCRAEYRGQAETLKEHGPFELETHERYRQQAARLKQ